MGISQAKVPAIVSTGIICLLVGVGIGVLGMSLVGGPSYPTVTTEIAPMSNSQAGAMPGAPAGGPPGMGGMGGQRGPNPKWQLVSLVTKLDLLSQKPLAISLSDQQKKQVHEQLQGLEALQELSAEEAKKRLDAMLETVKDQKETLEAAGYRWPGQGRFRPPADTPNPFRDENNSKALKSLQEQLGKPAAK